MAFRSQAFLFLGVALLASGETFAIRGGGTLIVDDEGMNFTSKKQRLTVWNYAHVQQVLLSEQRLQIVTYEDSPRWKLGVDRAFEFRLADPSKSFAGLQGLLSGKLGQRFVAAVADIPANAQWKVLVKRLGTLQGSEGTLYVAADRVVYASAMPGESRTWRLQDIENVNSSGRFELTLTANERARTHYGSMRSFNFRLKEPIEPGRVDELWRRVERVK